ncbi:LCP family protein [Brevibacterium antiquum]|uniref:Transcriptional attenuator, LytR family n=1 Tax=Brevibacterium antiquum TaxID=234835 RepID=A0A2H1JLV1_9MICO|nr:LCP family protein [Brevibacterium antiquum]SMX88401.1 transcriptional attenuator, LytR family [Brevibacterium antiquum]
MKKQTIIIGAGLMVLVLLLFGAGVGAYTGYLGLSWDAGTAKSDDPALAKQLQSTKQPGKSAGPSATDILFLATSAPESAPERAASTGFPTDLIMVAHIPADRSGVQLVSIPNDTWVRVPGHGHDTIETSAAVGGLPLAVRTVSEFLDISIDHVAVVDLAGLSELTDFVGGVEVVSSTAFESGGHDFTVGPNTLDGASALAFVQERKAFPNGDLQRIRNQQEFLRAVGSQVMSADYELNPLKMSELVRALSPFLTVDSGLNASTLVTLGAQLKGITEDDFDFIIAPTEDSGVSDDDGARLIADQGGLEKLKQAIADDTVSDFAFEAEDRRR